MRGAQRVKIRSDGEVIMERADTLAAFSSDGPNVLTRLYLTPEHRKAAHQVQQWMHEAGLRVHMDAAGTVVGRLDAKQRDAKPLDTKQATLPTVLLGSHIDTVRNAGKYDGNLGVLIAIQAAQRVASSGRTLPFAIEVLAFGDEEGVRFPVTLTSSRAVAGIFDPATLGVTDSDGISMRDALKAFGCDPDAIDAIKRDPKKILCYVEAHIEQGPVLQEKNLPVGIVTAISGATRLRVKVSGIAGHAGTVPMTMRSDACAAAAEMVLTVERIALDTQDVVGTVGRLAVLPGAVNVIASSAEFTVDVRSPDNAARAKAIFEMRSAFAHIAKRRNVGLSVEGFYDEQAATCAEPVMQALEKAVAAQGISPLRLPSGAGHDGLAMTALCPFGMLFIRCRDGISHNPLESVTSGDVQAAVDTMTEFLFSLDPAALAR